MSMLSFLISFVGMVILVFSLFYLWWKFGLLLKSLIFSRTVHYTIIRFEHLEEMPDLAKNPRIMRIGRWKYSPEGHYWKGFANISKEKLRQLIMEEYHLKAHQVLITVPEEIKTATAIFKV